MLGMQSTMNELRIAYLRPMTRSTEAHQRELVGRYAPDRVLVDDLQAVRNFMTRRGRVLIVPQLSTIDRKKSVVADLVHHVLSHGCTIIEARHDRTITPDCIDAVMAGLEAPRHDVDRRKQSKSGKVGGAWSKFTVDQLNATRAIWLSRELTYANARQLTEHIVEGGISYSTMKRHWGGLAVPLERTVGPGRR